MPGEQAAAGQEGAKAAAVSDVPDGVRGEGRGSPFPSKMVQPLCMVIHHLLSDHIFFSFHRPITPGSNRYFASNLLASSIEHIRRRVNLTWTNTGEGWARGGAASRLRAAGGLSEKDAYNVVGPAVGPIFTSAFYSSLL